MCLLASADGHYRNHPWLVKSNTHPLAVHNDSDPTAVAHELPAGVLGAVTGDPELTLHARQPETPSGQRGGGVSFCHAFHAGVLARSRRLQ